MDTQPMTMLRTHTPTELIVLTMFTSVGILLIAAGAYFLNTGFILAGLGVIILAYFLEDGTRGGQNHQ